MEVDCNDSEISNANNKNNETEDSTDIQSSAENVEDDITSPGRITPAPGASIQFKKPLLVGPRKGANKFTKVKPLVSQPEDSVTETSSPEDTSSKVLQPLKKVDKSPAEKIAENTIPVPYKEPKWSGLPNFPYLFEVLKSGAIVENIDLSTKPFYVFGRLGNCDIVMAHPTVSRFHAVMQYRTEEENDSKPGFYIYDLGSTHGTFLNKNKIKSNVYVRVQVGHIIKLGMSSRNFILQGPQDDEEPESEYTITELKEMKEKEQQAEEAAEKERIIMEALEQEKQKKKEEEDGIDWGMGEDADEETDLSENPFALGQNEELYINDPKKTLRGWFEREGYDLEYNCQEKSFGQFICRVELPIDNSKGTPVVAEAVVRGKKKESVVQCALEACRILDQYGLLRQSNHESKKRKAKNWEENDYYDSDDDTFLDRTGTVEKKRQLRMEQAGVKTNKEVHTYETLVERHEKIIEEIQKLEVLIKEYNNVSKDEKKVEENVDELDAYMSNLSNENNQKGKMNITKLKTQLASLKQEEVTVRNLANVAKPAELPQLKPFISQLAHDVKKPTKMPIFGKRKINKKPLMVFCKSEENKNQSNDSVEEMDSD